MQSGYAFLPAYFNQTFGLLYKLFPLYLPTHHSIEWTRIIKLHAYIISLL